MADFYSSVRIYKLCFSLTQYALGFIPRMLSFMLPVAESTGTTVLFTTQTPPIKYIPEATGLGGQLGFNSTGYINLKLQPHIFDVPCRK
jgi:hypothetical protein